MTLEQLEKVRIKYRNKIIIMRVITLIILIVFYSLRLNILQFRGFIKLNFKNLNSLQIYDIVPLLIGTVFIIIISAFVSMIFTRKSAKKYHDAYKDYFVLQSLNKIFTDVNYETDKGMSRETIANTKMLNMGDRYYSNDYVSAKYKSIDFEQADVHIEEEHETTDSDGNTTTTYVTIFRGRWMIFDFNKPFKADVQVCQKGFGANMVLRKSIFSKADNYFKKVKMESESFNKSFNVYAQSEHEAFYLLTPSLMEKIQKLETNNKGKMLLCFINGKLHIGLYDNKDSFEPCSCFKKIDESFELEKISNDIKVITQFVDELSLDNDLFKGGM